MKTDSPQEGLLQDVMAESGSGPSVENVLQLVRAEKRRRILRQKVAATVALGVVMVLSGSLMVMREKHEVSTADVRSPAAVGPVAEAYTLDRISDEELLALLQKQGAPAALVNLPDGGRELLLVVAGAQ